LLVAGAAQAGPRITIKPDPDFDGRFVNHRDIDIIPMQPMVIELRRATPWITPKPRRNARKNARNVPRIMTEERVTGGIGEVGGGLGLVGDGLGMEGASTPLPQARTDRAPPAPATAVEPDTAPQ